MDFLRRHLLLLVLVAAAAVVGLECGWLVRVRADSARARAALEQVAGERDWLARQAPAPSVESEQAIAAELAALRGRIETLRTRLQRRAPEADKPASGRPMDAYFELAELVENARARAIGVRVGLRPDERFGFAAYANEGPASELLPVVHRQQLAVEQVLEPLLEARPLALLGVKREAPILNANARLAGDDYFALEPTLSVARAGLVETDALRLEFTGQTSTLRTFLAGLADLRSPVLVRSVDVEPVPSSGARRAPAGGEAPVPVVRQSLSKFAVTVEFIQLTGSTPPPAS
jgi:hypothetical protein